MFGVEVRVKTQTLGEIQTLLATAGLRPRRRLGQNFLIDGNLLRKLVDAADIGPQDTVIEVGGGTGGLTDHLAARAGRVVVLEIDRGLHRLLESRFADSPNVEVHCQDALHNKNRLGEVLQRELIDVDSGSETLVDEPPVGPRQALVGKPPVAPFQAPVDKPPVTPALTLVANLPYGIAAPLLINLLLEAPQMRRFCFTVQREVADRMVAEPNGKTYGPLSITLQATCHIRRMANVSRAAFWPRPKVDSQMLRLDRMQDGPLSYAELRPFVSLVRASFLHRRKTMAYNLESAVGPESAKLVADLIDGRARPENVTVSQWITIYRRLRDRRALVPTDPCQSDA